MDKILEELHRLKGFVPTLENCGCQLRTCFGLPCAHELAMYVDVGSLIPLDSIDIVWRTLDFKPCVFVDYGNLNVDDHMQRWKEKFNNQPNHVKYSYIRKMEEIIDPSKIMINEPLVKKNNCERPTVKRGHHQSQAPPRYSCSDLNQEPPRHSSSFFDLNDEPTRHSSTFFNLNDEPNRHNSSFFYLNNEPARHSSFFMGMNEEPIDQCLYQFDLNEEPICQWSYRFDLKEKAAKKHNSLLKEIPSIFHPYITRIQNLRGDGNCGFSIGSCFVSDRRAPPEHYMLMPETGILIANRFGVIVQFLTTVGSVTFSPIWRGPSEFQNHRVLTFALVYINHYVMVQLEGEYLMLPISALWIRYKDPSAAE